MFRVQVKCPHADCGKSLMDETVLVSNAPSIHLIVRKGKEEGDLYLSSIYGDYNCIEPDLQGFSNGDVLEFFCPHCHRPLPKLDKCSCGAHTLSMLLMDGGVIKFCSRKGCHYHNLSFENAEDLYAFLDKTRVELSDLNYKS